MIEYSKTVLIVIISVLAVLNLALFVIAYPEMYQPTSPTLARDFSAYYEAGQAEYLGSVYSTFEPLVDKMFIYELRDGRWASPEKENYFGLLTLEGTEKEAYFVIWNISRNIENE